MSEAAPSARASAAVAALVAAAFVVPLFLVKYLPLVDLPQHAAQLSIWQHLDQPGFAGQYELNWRTPYLLVYLLARPLLAFASPLLALKIVLVLGVLALPAALLYLLRALDEPIDGWWALLGFPLALSYSFHWGFLNFFLAQGLGVALLAAYLGQLRRPTIGRGLVVAALSILLFYTHALAYAVCIGLAGLLGVVRGGGGRQLVARLWPLVVAGPIAASWYLGASQLSPEHRPTVWGISWPRLEWATAFLLGHPGDLAAAATGAVLLALPLLALRPRRSRRAWLPFVVVTLALLFGPHMIFGTAYLYGRLAVFVVPTAFLALSPSLRGLRPALVRGLVVAVCLTWAALSATRWLAFDEEARDFDAVVAEIAPGRAVRGIVLARRSELVPLAPVYDNFPIYVLAEKGGIAGFSFAGNFLSFARYKAGGKNRVTDLQQMHPEQFDLASEPPYDYYLVRAPAEVGAQLFRSDLGAIEPVANKGWWWLYRRR